MKKLLLIWVGAIVLLIVIGVIAGKFFGTANDAPEIPKTEISYKDDNGNTVTEQVDNLPITVTIDGKKYTYNSAIWKGKSFKIGKDTFEGPYYLKDFMNRGYEEVESCVLMLDEEHAIHVDYNTVYGYLFSVSFYTEPYNKASDRGKYYCDGVVLPANIKLGEATKEYVESIYGKAYEVSYSKSGIISVKYYANSDKRGERLVLYYEKETEVLCGIEWVFDTRHLA